MANFGPETPGEFLIKHFADYVQGRTFLINGVSLGGIGAEIATLLATRSPARLVLIASPDEAIQLQGLVDKLKTSDASVEVTLISRNLSIFKSVRQVAQEILLDPGIAQIDVVFNIQTELPRAYTKTEDGLEYLLQTNYLSHFLLTNLVLPKVLQSERPRVVNFSSSANTISGIRWHDPNFVEPDSYSPWTAYGQTKTAAVLFSVELNKRLASSKAPGFRCYAIHPGGVKTKLQEQLSEEDLNRAFEGTKQKFGEKTAREFFTWKTLSAASSTPLRAALDPSLLSREGVWLQDCELFTESVHLDPRATDPDSAQKFWKMSEEFVHEKFEY